MDSEYILVLHVKSLNLVRNDDSRNLPQIVVQYTQVFKKLVN